MIKQIHAINIIIEQLFFNTLLPLNDNMAPESNLPIMQSENFSVYQLNSEQVLKASTALIKHIESTTISKLKARKVKLLDEDPLESQPIWLQLTTKSHIAPEKRLKPIKVPLPHPLNTDPTTTICLFTVDPQRATKDLIASPAFPAALSSRITRIIGLSKLKSKWSQYEAQRKLYREHDIFVADDRIIKSLPAILGKTFYKSTSKRPIPINIQHSVPKKGGKRIKKVKGDPPRPLTDATSLAKTIEEAIESAVIYLSTSTNIAVRIGYASWSPTKLQENAEALSKFLIERIVSKKWKGLRSLHIKGAETTSLPIWQAEEIWIDEKDIIDDDQTQGKLKD
ncbi:putative electron transfer flavoprotein alpha-subunit [Erysiphe necator]|uniref:Putative electron transfer flavoprotein alpha-subunit n=1 Tax=Uncinula necator TaxID=52586 RepID=A0A0B1P5K7_UNCNE|nr:putative electron transfer flavoprotein alpha-subunit [Erysiphe necator]